MRNKKSRAGFRHLRQEDRDRMEALLDAEEKQYEIAKILKVDPSVVSREKKRRRRNGHYDADTAQMKANLKRSHSKFHGMKVESNADVKKYVIAGLEAKRSPDEIAGRMKRERQPFYASKNAIYRWLYSVYGQRYCPNLCAKKYYSEKRKEPAARRTMIPNRVSIDLRPLGATNKTRYGHFEGDTIVAPKKALNTEGIAIAAERKSKLLLGGKIPSLAPANMAAAVAKMEQETNMKSTTLDNGIENKYHERWDVPSFFADPHSPWQKPLIENSIGLLRRWYFKKGTDWSLVTETELQDALLFLNSKYRKSLDYQNALEVARAHGIMEKVEENSAG